MPLDFSDAFTLDDSGYAVPTTRLSIRLTQAGLVSTQQESGLAEMKPNPNPQQNDRISESCFNDDQVIEQTSIKPVQLLLDYSTEY